MSDIVEKLRQASLSQSDYRWEAADEIERLRVALIDIVIHFDWSDRVFEKARAALEGRT